ncbi:PaaX family transcriptional regulator C-terminal domain-containing protein [soil metagenome]
MTATATDAAQRERKGGHADLTRGSARSLLLTVLGELVWHSGVPARTSALLYVMSGLGVEERTARQAIVRGSDSGWIESHRHGREVSWSLSPSLIKTFEEGSPRVVSLSDPFENWDGRWLILFVTVPHALRSSRKRLYSDLEWAGFGNPSAGVWLSPHTERRDQVAALIDRLGLADDTLSFLGTADSIGLSEHAIVTRGWDLDSVAHDYATVLEEFRDPHPRPGDDLLFTHIRVLSELQRFPFSDPQLPEALLPDWIGRRVSGHFQDLRARWADNVAKRWAEINSPHQPLKESSKA